MSQSDSSSAAPAVPGANYDESRIPPYVLPDPLTLADGTRVEDPAAWFDRRRPELLRLFAGEVYGNVPGRPEHMRFQVQSVDTAALGGRATRKEVSVSFRDTDDGPRMDILLYLPTHRPEPIPLFLGLNFHGNHTIHADSAITLARGWVANNPELGIADNRAS